MTTGQSLGTVPNLDDYYCSPLWHHGQRVGAQFVIYGQKTKGTRSSFSCCASHLVEAIGEFVDATVEVHKVGLGRRK